MSGLTPVEATIMALWDEGCSTRVIARQMGYAKAQVARVVSTYRDNDEYGRACAAIARGSAQLAAAIAQATADHEPCPVKPSRAPGPLVPLPPCPGVQRHIFVKAE